MMLIKPIQIYFKTFTCWNKQKKIL